MKPFLLAASLALPLTLLPIAAGASGFAGIDIVSSEIEPDDGYHHAEDAILHRLSDRSIPPSHAARRQG